MLLKELFIMYFNMYSNTLKPSTYLSNYHTFLKHFNNTNMGNTEVKNINFITLQSFINQLLEQGYKPKTAKNILSILSVTLELGERLGLIERNYCNLVKLPRFDNKVYFRHSTQTQQDIIKAIIYNDNKYKDIFLFLLHGRRKNEVLSIKWEDIDFINESYIIRSENCKISKTMEYSLTPLLKYRLKEHYKNTLFNSPKDYVFTNPDTANKYVDLRKSWNNFLNKNNLPKMRLHDIRHLIGTYAVNHLGLSMESVMLTLGHANITTTHHYLTRNKNLSKMVINSILESIIIPNNNDDLHKAE
ncbi:tyrosine-type recombinase/integrase [Campylobacter sp. Cr9]|uniref:tyrosine-type recombinase/integrase n=1 Tax=Campylobacter sp. Cr9 TaxID=2735728 RepID=UPI0030147BCD|nr:tyrosine-type recombinase/integrase [Campylobacter sp. Cr9]